MKYTSVQDLHLPLLDMMARVLRPGGGVTPASVGVSLSLFLKWWEKNPKNETPQNDHFL